jgi:AP-3 complex subunit beta
VIQALLVKLQILTLAAKLLVLSPSDRTLGLLCRYVFSLARYDLNYDVRDRGRMLTSLLSGISPNLTDDESQEDQGGVILRREQVKLVLFEGKSDIVEFSGRTGSILMSWSSPEANVLIHRRRLCNTWLTWCYHR